MLANRTEAIDNRRRDADRPGRGGVARLVLGSATPLGSLAPTGEELAARITRLASMAAVLHSAEIAAARRTGPPEGGDVTPPGRNEVSP